MEESFDESNNNNQREQEAMDSHSAGKGRKRKKQYYNTIRQQMEFYFGDANLSKDRFLNKMIAADPFIPLNTFMSFNKIKEMTNSIEDIQKAIVGSELLELSGDKLSVRRTTEVRQKENIDEYVVYVEALPPNSTHESVKTLFKQFGDVAYVSLPKFKSSGRIKEFAFIEFASKNSVEQCMSAFRQFDGVIADHNDPEKLKSVTSYIKEQEELEQNALNGNENEDVNIKTENDDKDVGSSSATATKVEKDNNADLDSATESDIESVSSQPHQTKRLKLDVDSPSMSESIENDGKKSTEETKRKKKRRVRQHRKPKSSDRMNVPNEVLDRNPGFNNIHDELHQANKEAAINSIHVLRVATKVEWKRLRNKYLQLQREKYAEVKKLLQKQNKSNNNGKKVSTLPPLVRPVTLKTKPPPNKRICTRNINFYGAMGDDQNPAVNTYECSIVDDNRNAGKEPKGKKEEKSPPKETQFEFQPGLIVKVNFDQTCVDVADFKAEMKQYAFVQYVDIKEGQSNAYVRVDASRSAPILIKHCAPKRCQILTGESESEYWSKIARDREQKLSKSIKVPKTRERKMRNLIKNIAEINVLKNESKITATHIRFCD